jgi:hypothetical protein
MSRNPFRRSSWFKHEQYRAFRPIAKESGRIQIESVIFLEEPSEKHAKTSRVYPELIRS